MCGRFSLTSPVEALRRLFGFSERPNLGPRYNIAPTTDIAAIRLGPDETCPNPHYFSAHWGLIPSWSKSADFSARMINARSETVTEKPAFRAASKSRRCLIPANGFYEWQKIGKSGKQPWLIGVKDAPLFAFAGLWETWRSPESSVIESCTILTTTASQSISFIHQRMPVILNPADYTNWLNGTAGTEILKPMASESMSFYKVSPRIGKVHNDDADLLDPLEAKLI
ncbi:MAG: SOS response-associated peptidase [Sneathiella sp.]|nr:SOS response-associated peptidase [Sneathiella sp.]